MASCALACAPLVHVKPAYVTGFFQVRPCLDCRLIEHVDLRTLMSLALTVDAAAERCEKVKGAVFTQSETLCRIEAICRSHRPQQKPSDTLSELGMLEFVPYLARRLSSAQQDGQQLVAAAGSGYLNYVNLLNQAVMMSTQLYNDAANPAHHKYTAHQVALLYQSLNMLQGDTKPIRRLIEGRFDDIKAITESQQPYLDTGLSTWLQGITWLCREEITTCPSYIHRRIAPLLSVLNEKQ